VKIIIVDVSVITGYLLGRDPAVVKPVSKLLKDQALGKIELHAPVLIDVEVANALRFSIKDKDLVLKSYSLYHNLNLRRFCFTVDQIKEALQISLETNTSVYDASYHRLAQILGGTFVTCDKEYFKKAKELGDIELLS